MNPKQYKDMMSHLTRPDTKGIAEHFNLKPATIRKQRSRQIKNQLPSHKIGGQVRYNVIECEKAVEATKNAYQ